MRIAIHANQLCGRGTGKSAYDYGVGLRNLYGHEVMFLTSSLSANEGLARIAREFPVCTYGKRFDLSPPAEVRAEIEQLIELHRIEFIHMMKSGEDDQGTPRNCRTGIHCIFDLSRPHGDIYAAVSETLARKFRRRLYVPHIVKAMPRVKDVRARCSIPTDALVVGRHGGDRTLNLRFVHEAIREAVSRRDDLYFLFLSTKRFCDHPRVIHLPWVESEQDKFDIIHACDAMIHGRSQGETFGIAVGEFSVANKPVITWSGLSSPRYDRAHLEILGDRALQYDTLDDLLAILLNLNRAFIARRDWDVYSQRFSERKVMEQYREVFLKAPPWVSDLVKRPLQKLFARPDRLSVRS